jgi:hypothetical protein
MGLGILAYRLAGTLGQAMLDLISTFTCGEILSQSKSTMVGIGVLSMNAGLMNRIIHTMSKTTVYEGLKTAITRHAYPHHGFDDNQATILFTSWDQFRPFDKFLDGIDTLGCKLNIYAERVAGRSDGVAVTVDDQVQHLGYWTMYVNMREKVAAWEHFLSQVLKTGASIQDYDYETFKVYFDEYEYHVFNGKFEKNKSRFLLDGVKHYVAYPELKIGSLDMVLFSLEMPD